MAKKIKTLREQVAEKDHLLDGYRELSQTKDAEIQSLTNKLKKVREKSRESVSSLKALKLKKENKRLKEELREIRATPIQRTIVLKGDFNKFKPIR